MSTSLCYFVNRVNEKRIDLSGSAVDIRMVWFKWIDIGYSANVDPVRSSGYAAICYLAAQVQSFQGTRPDRAIQWRKNPK